MSNSLGLSSEATGVKKDLVVLYSVISWLPFVLLLVETGTIGK